MQYHFSSFLDIVFLVFAQVEGFVISDVKFPSKNILAREDTTLECVITVTDQWEKVTINQETETDFVFLAEFYNNGSVFSQVTTEFLSVVFKQDNETIETIIHINIQNSSSCPSLLHFGCGIIMVDAFKSVITKTSILSITGKLFFRHFSKTKF